MPASNERYREADHLECYGSVPALEAAFTTFGGRARRVVIGADDPGAQRVAAALRAAGASAWTFGLGAGADLRISEVQQGEAGSEARVALPGHEVITLRLGVPGLHNLRNATGVVGAALALEAPLAPVLEALARYRGLGRRFERLGEAGGIGFVDDYAHHPKELVATLAAARQAFPGRRIVAVFQPHLGRTQHVAGGVQAHAHAMVLDRLAVGRR